MPVLERHAPLKMKKRSFSNKKKIWKLVCKEIMQIFLPLDLFQVQEYIAPFGVKAKGPGSIDRTINGSPVHDIVTLVYKQRDGQVCTIKKMSFSNIVFPGEHGR